MAGHLPEHLARLHVIWFIGIKGLASMATTPHTAGGQRGRFVAMALVGGDRARGPDTCRLCPGDAGCVRMG